jgi:23S rRNA (adenine2030-N6)-methyltransferase
MNYRHAFHAGNFADVVKHALLVLALTHLRKKDGAFRVIDTHAGSGRTNLESPEAARGGEWQDGIGRLWTQDLGPAAEALLVPYREALRGFNPDGALKIYPGSPLLIRHFLRPQDRLIACEIETGAAKALARNLHGDPRIKAIAIDGWTALSAYIPPRERRGLVLIDPPFEKPDELSRLASAIEAAHRKWQTGTILAWYPIKDLREIASFIRNLSNFKLGNVLRLELIRDGNAGPALRGSGLIVVNPPFTLAADAQILLPALAKAFWPNDRNSVRIDNLAL